MSPTDYEPYYIRHLPHAHPPGAAFFVTCRLFGTIPQWRIAQLAEQARQAEAQLSSLDDDAEREQEAYLAHRRLFARWDRFLDRADCGPTWLSEPSVAAMVTESLHHRDGSVYVLICYSLMPNHLHLVFKPQPDPHDCYPSVTKIMQSLKGYTAFKANTLLERSGQFWQHESYDHWIRDEDELARIVRYVISNPVKARLVDQWHDWLWAYCKYPP